ncbi:MAG: cytochrome bc complex cytochrome b subunit [Gemmatimonadetes bacterium]|nr:cytochrome bc complex cytochrome b subunit [Gemmatimonadota bacterium]
MARGNGERRGRGGWLSRLWHDLVESTDAALLGFLRFLGLLYGPIARRLPIDQAFRKSLQYRLPAHAGWRHALGGITYLLFILMVITGVLLSLYYRPSVQQAYPSIQYIVSRIPFGWMLRDVHVWSASLIIVAGVAHLVSVFVTGAYKPPRETNWVIGLLLLLTFIGFGATGYLLPWDQWAYWTTAEVVSAVEGLPMFGGFVAGMIKGDEFVSGATLSRFFALHVIVLPWATLGLLILHFSLVRKHGLAPPTEPAPTGEGIHFWPDHLTRTFMVGVLLLAVVISLAALFPRPVGEPADPYMPPDRLVSTWVVIDVSIAIVRYLGPWGLGLFSLLAVVLFLLPLFDRKPETNWRKRPVATTLVAIYLLAFLVAWAAGRHMESVPPSASVGRTLEERVLPPGAVVETDAGDGEPDVAEPGTEGAVPSEGGS